MVQMCTSERSIIMEAPYITAHVLGDSCPNTRAFHICPRPVFGHPVPLSPGLASDIAKYKLPGCLIPSLLPRLLLWLPTCRYFQTSIIELSSGILNAYRACMASSFPSWCSLSRNPICDLSRGILRLTLYSLPKNTHLPVYEVTKVAKWPALDEIST